MASEQALVLRRAHARQALADATTRVETLFGVQAPVVARAPDAEVAAIQQLESVAALLNAVADAAEAAIPDPPAVSDPPPAPPAAPSKKGA